MQDAATQFFSRGSHPVDRTDDVFHQVVNVQRAAVGEFSFGQGPNPFVGVELRSVGRKVLDVQARVSTQELPQRFTVVRRGIVQQGDDGTPQVTLIFSLPGLSESCCHCGSQSVSAFVTRPWVLEELDQGTRSPNRRLVPSGCRTQHRIGNRTQSPEPFQVARRIRRAPFR